MSQLKNRYRSDNPNVNPSHYKGKKTELIDVLKDYLNPEEFKGFCKGLAIKYIVRADKKNGVEDYEKAQWYLQCLTKVEKERQNELPKQV